MASNIRGWLALGVSAGAVVVACGDDPVAQRTPAKLAQGCTLNSECVSPLICAFQRCHTACNETRDCPTGQRCVAATGSKNVCQLPDERECVTDSGCAGDQVCASDQQCRDECMDDDECIGSQVCSNQRACAEPTEVDASGNLPNAMGSGGAGGSGGRGGSGGSSGKGGASAGAAGRMMSLGGEGGDDGTGGTAGKGGGSGGNGAEGGEGAEGGTGGSSGMSSGGQSGNGGTAGATSSGGMSGSAGSSAGTGGTAGASGSSGSAGTAGSAGSGGASGCIESLWGDYSIRSTDGAVMRQESAQQPPIINGVTALSLKDVTSVQHGVYHGCASTEGGEAWCWPIQAGGNNQGQLGDGTLTTGTALIGVRVKKDANTTLDNVSSVAVASTYNVISSCAVSAGTVWCWGNTADLLNNGTAQQSVYATQVTTNGSTPLSNVLSMALSYGHACALVDATPDEVWCWGDNQYNEAGTAAGRVRYPTKVNGFVEPKAVRVTAETTYVLDGDRVKCFGRNNYTECGLTTNTNPVVTPTLVKVLGGNPLDGVVKLEGGSSEGCAVRNDQTLWCWGYTYANYAAATPTATPATGVLDVAHGSNLNPRYLTSDGKFHYGNGSVRDPFCGQLD
jgi:hypothetical protein